jgi:hypothetical protein
MGKDLEGHYRELIEILLQHWQGITEETHKKSSEKICDVQAEIQAKGLKV